MTGPRCVSVIGWSGAGKTTLIAELLPQLRSRGLRVLAVKHSGHAHPLHRPASDTERLQDAGAAAVAWVTPAGLQLTLPGPGDALFPEVLAALGGRFDLVLVEGWKDGPYPKIEVWRAELGPSLAHGRSEVIAVVSDDAPPPGPRHFRRSEVGGLVQLLLASASGRS